MDTGFICASIVFFLTYLVWIFLQLVWGRVELFENFAQNVNKHLL